MPPTALPRPGRPFRRTYARFPASAPFPHPVAHAGLPYASGSSCPQGYHQRRGQGAHRLPPPDGLIILDIRTPDEYRAGHIPNARNLDFFSPRFEFDLAELPKNTPILLYCRSGNRSSQALEYFQEAGLGPLYHLAKGFKQWQQEGMPVSEPEQAP